MFLNKNHKFQLWFYVLKSFATVKKKWANSTIISSKTNSTMTLEMASYLYKRVPPWKTTTEETPTASYLLRIEQQQGENNTSFL